MCIRVVVRGRLQIKTQGIFDCFANIFDRQRKAKGSTWQASSASRSTTPDTTFDESALSVGGSRARAQAPVVELPNIVQPDQYITATETRFSYNDLMSNSATLIELEPLKDVLPDLVQLRRAK